MSDGIKYKYIEVRNIIKKYGYELLSDKYINARTKLNIKDIEGYKYQITLSNLMYNKTPQRVSPTNSYSIENIKNYIITNKLDVELISNNYNNSTENLIFKCSCGNTYSTTWSSFMDQQIFRCSTCSRKKSSLAIITEDFLKELKVEFECEVKFEDCIDKSYLFFDYKIITTENNYILIEVDGQMHFKAGYDKELGLYNQQRRDKIKDNYCKNNNIKLIRIPYWEFDNDNYKEIIKKGLKNIITTH